MKTPSKRDIDNTLNNIADPEDARKVMHWFSTPEGEKYLSDKIDKDWKTMSDDESAENTNYDIPSNDMFENIMKQIRSHSNNRIILTVAAIFIPFLLLVGIYFELNSRLDLFSETEYEEIFVPNKEQVQFIFQDGSRVFLNSGSRLRYPKKFGLKERKVELEGEGFFEIAENKKRPFIVDLKLINIKVLGTSFDIKAYSDEKYISVSLENGRIEMNGDKFKSFNLKLGEKVVYDRNTGTYEIIRPKDIESDSAWKQKLLIFKDTPLSEVITTLDRTFDIKFEVADSSVLNYSFTLQTNSRDINFVIKELEKIAPVIFENNGNFISLKSK